MSNWYKQQLKAYFKQELKFHVLKCFDKQEFKFLIYLKICLAIRQRIQNLKFISMQIPSGYNSFANQEMCHAFWSLLYPGKQIIYSSMSLVILLGNWISWRVLGRLCIPNDKYAGMMTTGFTLNVSLDSEFFLSC